MRNLLAALMGILLLAGPTCAGETDTDRLRVADAFDRAQLTQDRAAMERLIADDLVFIESSGRRTGKADFIAVWTGPGDRYDPLILVDRIVVPLGLDAFMVSAETVLRGTSAGKPFASAFRYTDTFRRIHGQWRVVFVQVTRCTPSGNGCARS